MKKVVSSVFITVLASAIVCGVAMARNMEPIFQRDGYGFIPWHLTEGIYFNHPIPDGYELKFSQIKGYPFLEYGLVEESILRWTELMTYRFTQKAGPENVTERFIEELIKGFEENCRTIRPTRPPAQEDDGMQVQVLILQCLHNGNFASRNVREDLAVKYMESDWGIFSQQFAIRSKAGDDLPFLSEDQFKKMFGPLNVMVTPCQKDGELGFRKCSDEEAFK